MSGHFYNRKRISQELVDRMYASYLVARDAGNGYDTSKRLALMAMEHYTQGGINSFARTINRIASKKSGTADNYNPEDYDRLIRGNCPSSVLPDLHIDPRHFIYGTDPVCNCDNR